MTGSISSLVNGASAIAIGAYLAAVVYQGNASAFINEAQTDWQYLEFLIAAIILVLIAQIPGMSDIVALFVAMAFIGLALQLATKTGSLDSLKMFAKGEIGLFETIASVFKP